MSTAPDIFLSYNREDVAVAKIYADAFTAAGMEVWWDATLKSGEAYDEVTEAALHEARAVVVLWSPRSVSSRWVRAEATVADRNKTLMPVTIEPCNRPVMFELKQTVELSHWRGDADDKAWLLFLSDVRRMAGREAPAPAAPEGAPASPISGDRAGIPQGGVLPFTWRGDDGELGLLAEDLTEDVTRAFAENDYFRVIAAGTMAAWRGKAVDYRAVGRVLNARYLADGKLQKSGDTIRLTVHLTDTETANAVWSHRYAKSAAEIAASPDDLPSMVASELAEQMLQAETKRTIAKPGPYTAWEHVVRAMRFSFGKSADGPKSIEEARLAVTADPEYGLAHAVLAGAVNAVTAFAGKRLDDALKRELHNHATRALQIDGDNPAVLFRLWQAHITLGDGETMLRLARRLVELRPHSPKSYAALAGAYFTLGRTADAMAASTQQLCCKGFDPNPHGAYWAVGWCHLLEGDPLEAQAAFEQSLALAPNQVRSLQFKAIAEAQLGKEKAALASIRRLRDVGPDETIEQLVFFMTQNPRLARRSGEHIEILRRLWAATEPNA